MKISGDCSDLNPQPLPSIMKTKLLDDQSELKLNKSRLIHIKNQMKAMKEQIKKFTEILRKEIGEEIDIKELLRQGQSSGWQSRAQMVMSLRIKLIAMRSKFLDPPHKMYYRGPFDPKKEFDLKCLPQKQENVYHKMLEEKKLKIMQLSKPVAVLQNEVNDLCLMCRACRFRTKSLISNIKSASKKLDKSKENAEFDLRVIEAMIAHQSLLKMMIEPETFHLDPTLKRHVKVDFREPPPVSEWAEFKNSLIKTQRRNLQLKDSVFSFAVKLDKINKNLVESEQINVENRLFLEMKKKLDIPNKDKQLKDKNKTEDSADDENEYKILCQENRFLRQFLLNAVLSSEDDLKLFFSAIDSITEEFMNTFHTMKEDFVTDADK